MPILVACLVFAASFGAASAGLLLNAKLPRHHLSAESRDAVKLVMGLIATMSALVLGLLIASAKSSYDTQGNGIASISADIVLLDRTLAQFGAESTEARMLMRNVVGSVARRIWSTGTVTPEDLDPAKNREQANRFFEAILTLQVQNDKQRYLRDRALHLAEQVGQVRLLLFQQAGSAISWPFMAILILWIAVLFLGFGLTSSVNATVVTALVIGSLSVAAAMFLIVELDDPFNGLMKLSNAPIAGALTHIGQ